MSSVAREEDWRRTKQLDSPAAPQARRPPTSPFEWLLTSQQWMGWCVRAVVLLEGGGLPWQLSPSLTGEEALRVRCSLSLQSRSVLVWPPQQWYRFLSFASMDLHTDGLSVLLLLMYFTLLLIKLQQCFIFSYNYKYQYVSYLYLTEFCSSLTSSAASRGSRVSRVEIVCRQSQGAGDKTLMGKAPDVWCTGVSQSLIVRWRGPIQENHCPQTPETQETQETRKKPKA